MARWKSLEFALPDYLLLGRVAGISEADLQDQWQKCDRDTVIRKASEPVEPADRYLPPADPGDPLDLKARRSQPGHERPLRQVDEVDR